jgi:hypothetical protein
VDGGWANVKNLLSHCPPLALSSPFTSFTEPNDLKKGKMHHSINNELINNGLPNQTKPMRVIQILWRRSPLNGVYMPPILVITNDSLLGVGIKSLLDRKTRFVVAGASPQNEAELVTEINRLQPGIIVLDQASHIIRPFRLLELLNHINQFRIVSVSSESDLIRVYDVHELLLNQISDFIKVVSYTLEE